MKKIFIISILSFLVIISGFPQSGDDGWNNRIIDTYENDIEKARESITFVPGFDTEGHTDFNAYIDPDLPLNGGNPVTDGEFNMNYIRQFTPIHDNATETVPVHDGLDYSGWAENITYYEGLGRPIQKIAVKGTVAGTDLIQPIVYDDYGRINEEYLPYAIAQLSGGSGGPGGGDGTPGGYRPDFLPEQQDFHGFYNPGEQQHTFAEKEFDGSPLNRVMKKGFAGEDWDVENGNPIEFEYSTNGSEIPLFRVQTDYDLEKDGFYNAGTLYKNTIIDENGNKNIEYKDKLGQIIAKIISSTDIPGTTLETYYVYDDFGNLRYVISPNASGYMKDHADGTIGYITTNTTIQQLCYYYQYDERQRMTIKKLPGVEPVYMVYNKRDKLVLTQDGNLRNNDDWLFTKYDVFNRPVMTGKFYLYQPIGQEDVQQFVDFYYTTYFEQVNLAGDHGYTNDAFPDITSAGCEVYTVTYYDNYEYIETEYGSTYSFADDEITFLYDPAENIKGQVAAVKTKILPNSEIVIGMDYLISVNYYDKYLRLVQTITDNHLGGLDIISNKINFTGDIILTKENHDNGTENIAVQTEFEYDNGKRLKKTKHKINDESWVTVSEQKYDELGRVNRKYLHGGSAGSLQTVNFRYNIRNWLTDINDVANLENDLFAMNLGYPGGTYPQYNGNISSMQWKTSMFSANTYNFNYDGANRLTTADNTGTGNYNTNYSYDKNGNILTLNRYGPTVPGGGSGSIDVLAYTYDGNRLKTVNDIPGSPPHQNNGFSDNGSYSYSNPEYFYDANGNMISDLNKDMTITKYNYLNLPEQFNINSDSYNEISYLYSAAGEKLRKQTHIDYSPANTTDYIGRFVYEDDELKYILTDEGRVMANSGNFEYQYFLKDHLGNTRVTFTQIGEVIQEDSYYPFGLAMNGLNYETGLDYKNKYLYNGKELQDEFGLDWYDYGARFYDAQLGRFHTVDPLAEDYSFQSPFVYGANNPIRFIDFIGMSAGDPPNKNEQKTDWKKVGFYSKQVTSVITALFGYRSSMFGDVNDGIDAVNGQIYPNPDYDELDLSLSEFAIQDARNTGELDKFVDVINDANELLESNDLNQIDAYLVNDYQAEQLESGEINISDISSSKTGSPSTAQSEADLDENQDKSKIIFHRQYDNGFNEQSFSESGVIGNFPIKREEEE